MNSCRCTRNHGNFSFFMELVSSFSVLHLPRYKHRNSCYLIVPSVCLGKKRNYSTEIPLLDCGEFITKFHSFHNPSRGSSSVDDFLKYKSETHSQEIHFPHWFKNWQKLRKNKLTASTFPAAVGFWPRRRVQLWLEKLGAIEPFSGSDATDWSNVKEADAYELPSLGVLEIKCIRKASPWSRVPLYCFPQAQGLMEILGRDWMDFYVWTSNGGSLFRLYRDEDYLYAMKMALSDFWWKHIQPAKEQYDNYVITNPLSELSSLKPAPRYELCGYLVYESKLLVDNSRLLMREIHGKLVS